MIRLRILTYNIHRAIGVDRRFEPERVAGIIEHHDADIVLLQEVDRAAPRSDHLDLASWFARKLNYDFRAVGMNVFLKKGKYGNATLSRFPIGPQRNIDLTVAWRKRRGAQHTRICIPTARAPVTLDVFNVHLGLAERVRLAQSLRMIDSPDMRRLRSSDACIIAGDMNDWRNVLRKRVFAPAGFHCATQRDGGRWSIRTFPSFAPAGGLDKVFYRGPLRLLHVERSRLRVARVASDHLPVVADFELQIPRAVAHHPPDARFHSDARPIALHG